MDRSALAKRSVGYALAWLLSTVVGLGIVAVGAVGWALPAYGTFTTGGTTAAVLRAAAPGIVLILLGLLVWQVGTTAALYRTLTATVSDETAERFDSESIKSDILSVLDERLAEMHEDVERTRRLVERDQREDAADTFEFSEDV